MKSRSRREEESKRRRVRPSGSCLCRSPVTTLRASCVGCHGGRSRTSPPSCEPRALSSLSSLLQLTFSGFTGQISDSTSPPLVASLSGQPREYEGLTLLRSTIRSLAPTSGPLSDAPSVITYVRQSSLLLNLTMSASTDGQSAGQGSLPPDHQPNYSTGQGSHPTDDQPKKRVVKTLRACVRPSSPSRPESTSKLAPVN